MPRLGFFASGLGSPAPQTDEQFAAEIGRRAARMVFRKRGDHSEAHLSEAELAAIVEASVALALQRR